MASNPDKYAFTVRGGDQERTQPYSKAELAFLSGKTVPEIEAFVIALGIWDNFSVSGGMDATKWTRKDRVALILAAGALLEKMEANEELYSFDYSYRLPGSRSRSRANIQMELSNGERGLLVARNPGQLYAKSLTSELVEDLRHGESFVSAGIGQVRVYRVRNDVQWINKLRELRRFLKGFNIESVEVRHHWA